MASFFSFGRKRKAESEIGGEASRLRIEEDHTGPAEEGDEYGSEVDQAQQVDAQLQVELLKTPQDDSPSKAQDSVALSETCDGGTDLGNDKDLWPAELSALKPLQRGSGAGAAERPKAAFNSSNQRPQRSAEHNEDMRMSVGRGHLLNLPKPLRARILVLALVKTKPPTPAAEADASSPLADRAQDPPETLMPVPVSIADGDPASKVALLKVCHQIRNEGIPIFYMGNRFEVEICNFDGASLLTWWSKAISICDAAEIQPIKVGSDQAATTYLQKGGIQLVIEYEPHWDNLEEWMRLAHSGEMTWPAGDPEAGDGRLIGVAAAFQSVIALRDEAVPWDVTRKMLGGIRKSLIRDSADWRNTAYADEEDDSNVEDNGFQSSEAGVDARNDSEDSGADDAFFASSTFDPPAPGHSPADDSVASLRSPVPNNLFYQSAFYQNLNSGPHKRITYSVLKDRPTRPPTTSSREPGAALHEKKGPKNNMLSDAAEEQAQGQDDSMDTSSNKSNSSQSHLSRPPSSGETYGRPTQQYFLDGLIRRADRRAFNKDSFTRSSTELEDYDRTASTPVDPLQTSSSQEELEQDSSRSTGALPPSAQKESRRIPKLSFKRSSGHGRSYVDSTLTDSEDGLDD